jgi:Carbohydrate-binding family 9
MQKAPNIARYIVQRTEILPSISASWEDAAWAPAQPLAIASFHSRSSNHRPRTEARLLHNDEALAVIFRVEDRYVLARHGSYQSPTHEDSCVEFFVQPKPGDGYFNFEFNAIGTLLLWYIDRPRRPDGSFEHFVEVPFDLARNIAVNASLSEPLQQEMSMPLVWTLPFRVPKSLLESFVGPLPDLSGQIWRANFYKCADLSSHPHWGAWSEIGDRLDFHQPSRFGELAFD